MSEPTNAGAVLGLALRHGAIAAPMDHVVCVRVSGAGAFDVLERASCAALFLLDGQMRQSLFLDARGAILADVTIARDDRDFFVLAEPVPGSPSVVAHLEALARGLDAAIEDLTASCALVGVHGPFAWEVAAAVLGPEVIGVPYLSFYRARNVVCMRGGKTGEYGYDLLVPRADAAALGDVIASRGTPLGLVVAAASESAAAREALDAAALENGFFCARTLGRWRGPTLTPRELQLMWRVTSQREALGVEAVRARPLERRVTAFTSDGEVAPNDVVTLAGRPIGHVLAATRSAARSEVIGQAVLEMPWAAAGVTHYRVGAARLVTRHLPLIANRSLFVDPHRHSALAPEAYPPLVPAVLA